VQLIANLLVRLTAMALIRLHVLHHFVVTAWSAPHESLVLVRRKLRQLAEKCHDIPKKFIAVRHAPSRHAVIFKPCFTTQNSSAGVRSLPRRSSGALG
jgi:hypothetical protein